MSTQHARIAGRQSEQRCRWPKKKVETFWSNLTQMKRWLMLTMLVMRKPIQRTSLQQRQCLPYQLVMQKKGQSLRSSRPVHAVHCTYHTA